MTLLQVAERVLSPAAIHDTIKVVLRDPVYRRSLRRSLLDRLLLWLGEWYRRFEHWLGRLPSSRTLGLVVVALILLFVAVYVFLGARASREEQSGARRRRSADVQEDPWASADTLAGEMRFEEAAHALYRGVLATLSRGDRLRLDPSRTSGDYARELRRRGSSSVPLFTAFTRRFESAVYGHEQITADLYAELRGLSEPFRPRARAA